MGLFDLFKKKENKQKVTITEDDSLAEIGTKLAKAGVISDPKDDKHNSFGDDIEHLVNGELPWGWYAAKEKFIKPRDKKMIDAHVKACQATSVTEEKMLLEKFLKIYYSYKEECAKKGECYVKYFSDMHEHCHNSSNPDFAFCEPAEERLAYINEHFEELVAQEQLKEECLRDLDKKVETIIRNTPGILQSDLIKQIDPIVKAEIQSMLYQWSQEGKVLREKKGRSYSLTMKK